MRKNTCRFIICILILAMLSFLEPPALAAPLQADTDDFIITVRTDYAGVSLQDIAEVLTQMINDAFDGMSLLPDKGDSGGERKKK